jgi:hypothetical protein
MCQDIAGGGCLKDDEKRLLKHAVFWAALVAGFWLSVSVIHWWVIYFIFYRDAERRNSK